ncbi:unnamed protein product [Vitrella brassicaformis CCMP3155]|uniref:Major facilitator superfamily (MFS) profile domain-containing protein n=2 Tax=Vitrella brassicaformis TaxID=1169539 RepID=A0A0G4F417_VITBC|nr:unnamed protein product [Vitrella brassicaformis CCMP3155]|eukprot:CEM06976.1 unnamed protein product [Vitrella brassicaformis CCMP3155]
MKLHYSLIGLVWMGAFLDMMYHTTLTSVLPKALTLTNPLMHALMFEIRPTVAILGAPVAGILIQRYGWRAMIYLPFQLLAIAGAVLFVGNNSLTYLCVRILQGLAAALLYPAGFTAVSRTHDETARGTAVAIALTGDVAIIIGPLLGGLLYDWGGRHLLAASMLALTVLTLLALFSQANSARGLPSDIPSIRDGLAASTSHQAGQGDLESIPQASSTGGMRPGGMTGGGRGYGVFANLHFVVCLVGLLVPWMTMAAIQALLPLYYATRYHLSASYIGLLLTPPTLMEIIMGIGTGALIDICSLSHQLITTIGGLLCSGSIFLLAGRLETHQLDVCQPIALTLFGAGFGAVETSSTAFAAKFMDDHGIADHGRLFAVLELAFNSGLLFGPLLSSIILFVTSDPAQPYVPLAALYIPLALLSQWSYVAYRGGPALSSGRWTNEQTPISSAAISGRDYT